MPEGTSIVVGACVRAQAGNRSPCESTGQVLLGMMRENTGGSIFGKTCPSEEEQREMLCDSVPRWVEQTT